MPGANQSYTSGRFLLDLDGIRCGFIESLEGGHVSAEVIAESVGPDYFVKKHIGQLKHEDFSIRIGLSMEKKAYDWIAASWKANYQRMDGSVIIVDSKGAVKAVREFYNAMITETTIPALDGSSKDAAFMSLKFSPEFTRFKKASGKVSDSLDKGKHGQKKWLAANFRLEIDGLDCTKVSKVDRFIVKQATGRDDIGVARDQSRGQGKLDFPNLKITLPEFVAQSWFDWHEDFVIKGNCGDDKEKNGALTFLTPTLKEALARVDFYHLGIFRITAERPESRTSRIAQVVAELYCERMEFVYYP
jgi:phage tail-like protein